MNEIPHPRAAMPDRLAPLRQIGEMHGFFDPVGPRHHAFYVQEGDTLLVTFDEVSRLLHHGEDGLPTGFSMVKTCEWSLLSILAEGATWFRDENLYRFFDTLARDGFFQSFEKVVFFGAGPMCGHAAAAFSAACPGAHVLALSPVATLNRSAAPFELRFRRAWRKDFTSRYGAAPDALGVARSSTVIYDPTQLLDAAQAALFRPEITTRLRFWGGGAQILNLLEEQRGTLNALLSAVATDRLDAARLSAITRKLRHASPDYLRALLTRVEERGGAKLAAIVARRGVEVSGPGYFSYRFAALEAEIASVNA